jgi:ferritin-like metal-binding protein YciE
MEKPEKGSKMNKQQETLQKYVSDMLSVERHIHEAFKRQRDDGDFKNFPEAHQFVTRVDTILQNHISRLESHLEALGGNPSAPVKAAVSSVLGVAAGIIDKVRQNDKISADLRDDYTALNLAAISYTMLHTTGLALMDQKTADLARDHLMDLTPLITRINEMIPNIVARELQDEGATVGANVSSQAVRNTQEAWSREHVHAGHPHR